MLCFQKEIITEERCWVQLLKFNFKSIFHVLIQTDRDRVHGANEGTAVGPMKRDVSTKYSLKHLMLNLPKIPQYK